MATVNQHVTRGNLIFESSLAAEKNPRIATDTGTMRSNGRMYRDES